MQLVQCRSVDACSLPSPPNLVLLCLSTTRSTSGVGVESGASLWCRQSRLCDQGLFMFGNGSIDHPGRSPARCCHRRWVVCRTQRGSLTNKCVLHGNNKSLDELRMAITGVRHMWWIISMSWIAWMHCILKACRFHGAIAGNAGSVCPHARIYFHRSRRF